VEKYGTTGQATDDSKIWLMRLAWWVTIAADAH
jgi:hypothetical protein